MSRHERRAAVAAFIAAALLDYAAAGGGNREDGIKLLRREQGQQKTQGPPCDGKEQWTKNWAKMGMPCNYKKEVVYPGALPLPFPRKDVHAILNKTKAMLKGHTYEDELTTTSGPSTSGEARPLAAGIAEPLEAKPTPSAEVPLGLKEAVEWREMTRSVPVSPMLPGKEKKRELDLAPVKAVQMPGGPVYRPHFVGATDQVGYYLDEDPKMKLRPSYQNLKDTRDLHDSNVTSPDVPPSNPTATQTRDPKNKEPIGQNKSKLEGNEGNDTQAEDAGKPAAMTRISAAMNQEVKGAPISREADN